MAVMVHIILGIVRRCIAQTIIRASKVTYDTIVEEVVHSGITILQDRQDILTPS
jgi:hypothetical protein